MTTAVRLMTRPCTLRTTVDTGERDEMGEPIMETNQVETVCELQQSSTSEQRDGGLVAVSSWNLYLPPDAEADASSEVDVDGGTYSFAGNPWRVRHPITGVDSHLEAIVRQVR